jgi:hypothetical protein
MAAERSAVKGPGSEDIAGISDQWMAPADEIKFLKHTSTVPSNRHAEICKGVAPV